MFGQVGKFGFKTFKEAKAIKHTIVTLSSGWVLLPIIISLLVFLTEMRSLVIAENWHHSVRLLSISSMPHRPILHWR